ncbi:MAG: hypothetical protein V1875_05695 [Candidatus Altiarchaeota archaeon]
MPKITEEMRRRIHGQNADLPGVMEEGVLNPPENLDKILAERGLDVKSLTDRPSPVDVYTVLDFTATFDVGHGDKQYEVTHQVWDLLAAAKKRSGPRGLTQALTGMLEMMKLSPETFPSFINGKHHRLKFGED